MKQQPRSLKYKKEYMLKTKEDIKDWLDKYNIVDYIINDDLTVDVAGDVVLGNHGLTELPVQFRNIKNSFDCSNNKLTSLIGSPISVGSSFSCSNNQLQDLKYCPINVGYSFLCDHNPIANLSNFNCDYGIFFIHYGSIIPGYEVYYTEVSKNNSERHLRLTIKKEELMRIVPKVELMRELSKLPTSEVIAKKPKI